MRTDDSCENKIPYFFRKLGKMSQNLSSAEVICALRVKVNGGIHTCLCSR